MAYLDSYSYASFSASISIVIDRGGVRVVPHRVTVLLASPWPTRSPPALDEARGRGGDSGGLRRTLTAPAPPGRSAPSPRPACPLVLVTLTGRQWVARTRHSHTAHAHRPLISSPSIGPPQAQPLRAAGHAIAIDCQPIPLSRQSPFGRIPLLTARVQRVFSSDAPPHAPPGRTVSPYCLPMNSPIMPNGTQVHASSHERNMLPPKALAHPWA